MATLQQAEAHRTALDDLTTLAIADLVREWRDLDLDNPARVEQQMRVVLADLSDGYGNAAAGQAADWYETVRDEARTPGAFRAALVSGAAPEQIESLAGWGTSPLYGTADPDAALSRLAGGLQRYVTDADRRTIVENTRRDPAKVAWYRAASANACAFCAMVASRGAVYRSETTGSFKSHNYCRCFAVPLFPGERVELPSYYGDFSDAYATAAEQAAAAGEPRSQKSVLSRMRLLRGTR